MIKVLGLALYGPLAASHRYRLSQYKSGLYEEGIDLEIFHLLGDDYLKSKFQEKQIPYKSIIKQGLERLFMIMSAKKYDLSIVHCELFPFLPGLMESFIIPKPYIYDFDDAFYLKYTEGRYKYLSPFLRNKFKKVISNAAAVTAGNHFLLDYAINNNKNSFYFPTVVNTERYKTLDKELNDAFTIGWIGSPSTANYLKQVVDPLEDFGKKTNAKLVVIGGDVPDIKDIYIEKHEWTHERELNLINTFDVGIMPLNDDNWSRGKCAFKLIQYMACSKPVIASDVGANKQLVSLDNGFLVSTKKDWLEALSILQNNPELSNKMGKSARQKIENEFSLKKNLPILKDIILKVHQRKYI